MKNTLSEEQLAILNESFPVVSDDSNRLTLPRFGMLSKDIVEENGKGKNKTITVIEAAGTFYVEKDEGETDENGKKKWTRTYLEGDTVDVVIVYHRRQLRKYDSSLEKYISTPIFDSSDQQIPLYLDGQIIKTGTQEQLQAMYPALTQKGKPTSDLKEEMILYVIYEGELYQANISQSSKWAFKSYARNLNPSAVVTTIGSEEAEFGTNKYRVMTFKNASPITTKEFPLVTEAQDLIKEDVAVTATRFLPSGDSQAALPSGDDDDDF